MTGFSAIIVAGGKGARTGLERPKQWEMLLGKRVIDWSVDTFFVSSGPVGTGCCRGRPDCRDQFSISGRKSYVAETPEPPLFALELRLLRRQMAKLSLFMMQPVRV
jgi:hypothetical protein